MPTPTSAIPIFNDVPTKTSLTDESPSVGGAMNLSLPVSKRSIKSSCCTQDSYTPWRDQLTFGTDPIDRVLCPYVMKCHCNPDLVPSQYWVAELRTSNEETLCEKMFTNAHCQPMSSVVGFIAKKGADGKDIVDCASTKPGLKKIVASFICMADSKELTFRPRIN